MAIIWYHTTETNYTCFTSLHMDCLLYVHMHRNTCTTQLPCAQYGTMYILFIIYETLVDVSSNTDLHDVIYF